MRKDILETRNKTKNRDIIVDTWCGIEQYLSVWVDRRWATQQIEAFRRWAASEWFSDEQAILWFPEWLSQQPSFSELTYALNRASRDVNLTPKLNRQAGKIITGILLYYANEKEYFRTKTPLFHLRFVRTWVDPSQREGIGLDLITHSILQDVNANWLTYAHNIMPLNLSRTEQAAIINALSRRWTEYDSIWEQTIRHAFDLIRPFDDLEAFLELCDEPVRTFARKNIRGSVLFDEGNPELLDFIADFARAVREDEQNEDLWTFEYNGQRYRFEMIYRDNYYIDTSRYLTEGFEYLYPTPITEATAIWYNQEASHTIRVVRHDDTDDGYDGGYL